MPDFTLHELCSLDDDWLLPWLTLYETAFPVGERILIAPLLNMIKQRARGADDGRHLLCAINGDDLLGLIAYHAMIEQRAAFLWYMAVSEAARGQGFGSTLYRALIERLPPGTKALVFDVEDPDEMPTPAMRAIAERRIGFYRRLGAKELSSVSYIQYVGDHQPALHLRLMLHPLVDLDARAAYALAKQVVGDALNPGAGEPVFA